MYINIYSLKSLIILCSSELQSPSRFCTEGITSSTVLSLRSRRDRTADDAIPSVRNFNGPSKVNIIKITLYKYFSEMVVLNIVQGYALFN